MRDISPTEVQVGMRVRVLRGPEATGGACEFTVKRIMRGAIVEDKNGELWVRHTW